MSIRPLASTRRICREPGVIDVASSMPRLACHYRVGRSGSHVAMVSHPGEVAQLIETAAEAVLATS